MKVAITVWNGRIAPVFDSAERCFVIDRDSRFDIGTAVPLMFNTQDPKERAALIVASGANALICGAISIEYEEAVTALGLEVFSFISGPLDEVFEAWKEEALVSKQFSMPGCGCPRRRCRRRGGRNQHSQNL